MRRCSTARSVGSLSAKAGIITGYDGAKVPFEERFFDGGDTFRGFALAGIGPRDINAPTNTGAIGGTVHAIGTFALRMPGLLPESYGINAGLFTDFGTLGRLDDLTPASAPVHRGHAAVGGRFLHQGQSGVPRLRRHQRPVEIAVRTGSNRPRPALCKDQI